MSELKPCPFCGHNEYLETQYENGDHWVYCDYCGATGSVHVGDNSEFDLWNTRPIEDALRAEVERLTRYYKNGIDCFASPCERHSGERTPPFAEFFEKYGGQCLICVVDNNKVLQAENERLKTENEQLTEACKEMKNLLFRQVLKEGE